MAQPPKTSAVLEAMREGGRILAGILRDLKDYVQPGMTGLEIDTWVAKQITARGASATYQTPEVGFPNVICISKNDEIVHGVPTDEPLTKGDVVSFDLVITYQNMKTDSAFTMVVGEPPKGAIKHLLAATERSLYGGIDAIKGDGTRIGDISAAVEKSAARRPPWCGARAGGPRCGARNAHAARGAKLGHGWARRAAARGRHDCD